MVNISLVVGDQYGKKTCCLHNQYYTCNVYRINTECFYKNVIR